MIVLYLLSFFGLTYAIQQSSLLNRFRIWLIQLHPLFMELLECPFCTGFWSGLIVYGLSLSKYISFILFGLAGAAASLIITMILDFLGREKS